MDQMWKPLGMTKIKDIQYLISQTILKEIIDK